jgi:hypothetical protein
MSFTNNAAFEIPSFYVGVLEANVDMSSEATWQFTVVDVAPATGTGLLGEAALVAPASGAAGFGILQNNPQLGEAGNVMCLGVSKAKAGGTFAAGDLLMTNGSGFLVAVTTGNFAIAKALQAGASGNVVAVYLSNYGKQ